MIKSPKICDWPVLTTVTMSLIDPQLDFAQLLKEAKTQADLDAANPQANAEGGRGREEEEELGGSGSISSSWQKKKKSWSSLCSWFKADKKKMSNLPIINEPPKTSDTICKPRRGYVSGPINGGGGSWWLSRSAFSGPLSGLLNLMEDEKIRYVCLNNPPSVQSYVPVYLVT